MQNYTISLTPIEQPTVQQPQPQMIHPDIVRCQCVAILAEARVKETHVFLGGLAEIRMALNMPSVTETDAGIGDRQPLQPMFDELDIKRLRERYITLLDRYCRYAEFQESQIVIPKAQ